LFIFTLVSKLGFQLVYEVYYQFNVKEITATFCENKAKPKLHCNGKCHLAKKMAAAEGETNKEKSTSKNKLKSIEVLQILSPAMDLKTGFNAIIQEGNKVNYFYKNQYQFLNTNKIEHPPSA